jgi:hypothetical protein
MNDAEIRQWAAFNLSLILEKNPETIASFIGDDDINIFRSKFFDIEDGLLEQAARFLVQGILDKISSQKRWQVTGFLKKIRNLLLRKPLLPSASSGTKMIEKIAKRSQANFRNWDNKRAAVCLMHDVDTPQDFAAIATVIEIEQGRNIRSVFNFLTAGGYAISRDMLSSLAGNGFEVGLHGVTHDIALAYRSAKKIELVLSNAVKASGFQNPGFRSPALSMSAGLRTALGKVNISYDSSVSLYYKDLGSCFPYIFPETGVWELPLCLQDDVLFRDLDLSQDEAYVLTKEFIEDVKRIGGVCVLNFHPALINAHLEFYRRVVNFLCLEEELLVTTGKQLVELMEKRRI